jgi:O-methyltransferase
MSPTPDESPFLTLLTKYMSDAQSFFRDAALALAINGITGDYVEFGAWGSKSLSLAHEAITLSGASRHLWAFDSFVGLPEAADPRDVHPQWGAGGQGLGWTGPGPTGQEGVEAFHAACAKMGIPRDAYTAVEGFFEDTLPALGTDGAPADIALAYIDCNMYSSTVSVLDFLAPRMKHGMIIGVDDYECWSPTDVSGERAALHEFQRDHPEWRLRRYKDVHWGGVSFVVEHAHLLPDA